MGKDPKVIEPLVPVDLVVDHSVQIDHYGSKNALDLNMKLEFKRNEERYQFMKWGMQAFDTFKVVPPGIGIVHQVNLEYLARGVHQKDGIYYPDTLVGTDSHTTMINGIGVVGWGVGGIEAEAGMLGQPVYFLTPDVVGVNLKGKLHPACTATDLVLTVTEMLRKAKVVGQVRRVLRRRLLVAVGHRPRHHRQHGARVRRHHGLLPGRRQDGRLLQGHRPDGRRDRGVRGLLQGAADVRRAEERRHRLQHRPGARPVHGDVPRSRGPKRPQDRINLDRMKSTFTTLFSAPVKDNGFAKKPEELQKPYRTYDGIDIRNGDVLIAAITSCTNTSNPGVLLAAGLLAKKAVELGLTVKPHIKTSLAPGSRVVTEYLTRAGLLPYLEKLGFFLAGYGCTTCIGNAGPARAADRGSDRQERAGLRRGALRQPQLRGTHPPEHPRQLSRLATPGGRLRDCRFRAERFQDRAARQIEGRAGRLYRPHLAGRGRGAGADEAGDGRAHLPQASTATSPTRARCSRRSPRPPARSTPGRNPPTSPSRPSSGTSP
jgi:aconitate hydratase